MAFALLLGVVLLAALATGQTSGQAVPFGKDSEGLQTLRNLGKAHYEQGMYAEALAEFKAVVASGQALGSDYLNLGLAQMQLLQYDDALGSFSTFRQIGSDQTAAEYNLGILYSREGRYTAAEAELEKVVSADRDDPAAWFNLGRARFYQHKYEPALVAYGQVLKMGFSRAQNFYVVALFHTFTTLNRLERPQQAQKYLELHQEYRQRVPDVSMQPVALERGNYGEPLVPPLLPGRKQRPAQSVDFSDVTSAWKFPRSSSGPADSREKPVSGALAIADYDGDGRQDLYLTGRHGKGRLLQQRSDGNFADVTRRAGLNPAEGETVAVFSDYDNSGHPSLFVAGKGGVRSYRAVAPGRFREQTTVAGFQNRSEDVVTCLLAFDADNDGFLDLVVGLASVAGRDGGVRFYRNNTDGTFSDMTPASKLPAAGLAIRQALFADFNHDPYLDLLLLPQDGPPMLYVNVGAAQFHLHREAGLDGKILEARVADFNHDGSFDLLLRSRAGYEVLLNDGEGRFSRSMTRPALSAPGGEEQSMLAADLDGDSFDDLLLRDHDGKWHFLANRATQFEEHPSPLPELPPLAGLKSAWLGSPVRFHLLGLSTDGSLRILEQRRPASRWLRVMLEGWKSNQQGVGALVEFKAGNFYRKLLATGEQIQIPTGKEERLDVVRVTWPTGIIQNLTEVPTDQSVEVRESDRMASSCPLLYYWGGDQWHYLTDVLGVAPLGALAPDGSYLPAHPQELVRLPSSLRPRHDRFVFQFTDEMREVDYFDGAHLLAVEHRDDEQIYADEKFAAGPVPLQLYRVGEEKAPKSAWGNDGSDVRAVIAEADGRTVGDFQREPIPGLAELHTLTLDLGSEADAGSTVLWLTGWVWWADSNSARALMSGPREMVGPYLQVRETNGEWVTAIPDMGLPSGANRTMRVDLRGLFRSADRSVRIVTNLAIYWDRIFFTTQEDMIAESQTLLMVSAHLHYRGFSRPQQRPGQADDFQYAQVEAAAPWDPAKGTYTRYGDVEELVGRADDLLVVMAPGDELTVEFEAALADLPPGRRRTFFLQLEGWAKDAEPNTAAGSSSEPLPFRNMSVYPYSASEDRAKELSYRRYLRVYQTRPGYRLIPRLAPLPNLSD